MRKRRKAANSSDDGDDSDAENVTSWAVGTSKNNKLSVFDFAGEDMLVETVSRKHLSKYAIQSPSEKPRGDLSVDKYMFLESFAKGDVTAQTDTGKGTLDKISRLDSSVRAGSATISLTDSLDSHDSECFSCGKKSNVLVNRRSRGCRTERNQNSIWYIDCDEDGRMPFRTSTHSDLAEKKCSSETEVSEQKTRENDCEAVVVVSPKYVKYKKYYTNCLLSFTRGYIRLEGSSLCERNRSDFLEWSTSDMVKIEHQPCESVKADVVNLHLKILDGSRAEASNSYSGFEELEFVVLDDPQWFIKQEEIKSLDPKYENAWATILSECSFSEPFDEIIYPEGDTDAVFVSRKDVELLQPRTFLNDTIIDFYLKYLLNKMKPEERGRFHVFNTFFFQKLANMDRDLSRNWDGREAFQRVRKWTRNINLFEKDYIFIPVNFSLHWSLIVICFPGEITNLRDDHMEDSSRKPCILHMDSIRGSHRGLDIIIRSYLWEEWKARNDEQESDMTLKFSNLHFIVLQLPQQENLFDCGLFLLHYAELFLVQSVTGSTMYNFLNEDWFLPAEVSVKKREHIRRVIHRIVEDIALRNPPATNCSSDLDEGDSGVKVVEVYDEKMCDGVVKDIEQKSFLHRLNPVTTDDKFHECEPLMPLEQIEAIEIQDACLPGGTSCSHEACGDNKHIPLRFPHDSPQVEEMEIPPGTSENCASTSEMASDIHNLEDCVHEIASSSEMEKDEYKCSSVSTEDFADCVVEDSEEQSDTEIISSRTPCFPARDVINIVE